jgi:uncharacterized protein
MPANAQTYIQSLQLRAHPEGGFYRETYRSPLLMNVTQADQDKLAPRNVSTGIYFLLEQGNFSAFHKIRSDEMWHFYAGQALEVLEISPAGDLRCTRLGPDVLQGEVFQHVVPAHTWFASRVAEGGAFSLVGCTVAPGFDFADFFMADRAALAAAFPQHRQTVYELTR